MPSGLTKGSSHSSPRSSIAPTNFFDSSLLHLSPESDCLSFMSECNNQTLVEIVQAFETYPDLEFTLGESAKSGFVDKIREYVYYYFGLDN